jgi:iron complex transport system substrate-binding protein
MDALGGRVPAAPDAPPPHDRGGSRVKRIVISLWVVALATSGCGGGDDSTGEGAEGSGRGYPVEVAGITVPDRPERIVSLSPTHTEVVYALGAGDRVVATDLFSNHPAGAAETTKIDSFNLSVEAVADLDPDLVFYAFDPGDAVDGFAALGIPAVLFYAPQSLEEAFEQILIVGEAVGEPDAAEDLVAGMQSEIDEIVDSVGEPSAVTYFHELDSGLYTVTSSTFIGQIYGLFGMRNIADAADDAGTGYPQLSAEYVLDADPDVIFLGDTLYGETAETVGARPGWDALRAVREGRVVELDSDVASRWGPRLVEFVRSIADAVKE